LRVLTATSSFPRFAGDYHGKYVFDLSRRLVQLGAEITVLAPRSRSTDDELPKLKRFRFMPSKKLEKLPEQTLKRASFEDSLQLPFYLGAAFFNIVRERADLVHAHFAIPMGFISALNPKKVPLLITCHGSDCTLPFDAHLYSPFVQFALRKAGRVVAVSKFIRGLALKLGAGHEKTEVVYMGVDTDKFKPPVNKAKLRRELGMPNNEIIIGSLGRLVAEKSVEDLIRAAPTIEKKIDAHFVIGGEGPQRSNLEKLAKALQVRNIQFLGEVRDPAKFLQMCDVYVLTSVREGLSVSLQEAMATGVVPVAVNGFGCPEVIDDCVDGFLFNRTDVEDLTRKILDATNNLKIGVKSREKIVESFNIDRSASRYIEIYDEIISQRRRV
jgi:glycosyltransferase involved in cell wall biosynthesis